MQQQATFLGGGLTPAQQKDERFYHFYEEKNCQLPIFLGGNLGCAALWYLSQRNILPFLSFINTTTLFTVRESSGITRPDAPLPKNSNNKKMTEAKKQQLRLRNADRLVLASGNCLACFSWAATFGIHAAKVLYPPNAEMAEMWRGTAGKQVGVSVALTTAMVYKGVVEAMIAYEHRYD